MYFCTEMRNIEAKMAAFTDAGLYEQDSHIDFEAEEHVYIYRSQETGVRSRESGDRRRETTAARQFIDCLFLRTLRRPAAGYATVGALPYPCGGDA